MTNHHPLTLVPTTSTSTTTMQTLVLFLCFISCRNFFISVESASLNISFSTTTTTITIGLNNHHQRNADSVTDESDHDTNIISNDTVFPSELYHSRQEPFRSFPCYPKYIHLAQGSDMVQNAENEWVINMTVSFALDYISCACAIPNIVYSGPINRKNKHTTSHAKTQHRLRTGGADGFERFAKVPENANIPLQFNYTSDKTNGKTYQSDWIYHLPISSLHGGLQTYDYRIVVIERNDCPMRATYPSQRHEIVHAQPSPPSSVHYQQQSRSLRGSNGYYIGETKVYTFITPPIPGQATSMALVGDLGQTLNSAQTIYRIYTQTNTGTNTYSDDIKRPNFTSSSYTRTHNVDSSELDDMPPISQLLIAGDLSYADSDPVRWTSYLEFIEPLVRTIPLHVVAGNHEIECDTHTNNLFVPYEHWFSVPNRIQSAMIEPITDEYKQTLWDHSCSAPSVFEGVYNYGNSFYSYQHGLVYVIVLNSYSKCTKGSVQYGWLVSELEKYRQNGYRVTSPWILISFHAPLYTTFLGHVDEKQAVDMKEALEPIFIKYGVNIIVSGHDHAYMRTYPLSYDKIDTTGRAPIYLTLGAGGNREGHSRGYRNPFGKEAWVATRTLDDFGYGHLFVPNATHARFHWVRDRTSNNDFEDIVWLLNLHATGSSLP